MSPLMMSWIDISRASTRVDIWFTEIGENSRKFLMQLMNPLAHFGPGFASTCRQIWCLTVLEAFPPGIP